MINADILETWPCEYVTTYREINLTKLFWCSSVLPIIDYCGWEAHISVSACLGRRAPGIRHGNRNDQIPLMKRPSAALLRLFLAVPRRCQRAHLRSHHPVRHGSWPLELHPPMTNPDIQWPTSPSRSIPTHTPTPTPTLLCLFRATSFGLMEVLLGSKHVKPKRTLRLMISLTPPRSDAVVQI
jgi:hypothetical protein